MDDKFKKPTPKLIQSRKRSNDDCQKGEVRRRILRSKMTPAAIISTAAEIYMLHIYS